MDRFERARETFTTIIYYLTGERTGAAWSVVSKKKLETLQGTNTDIAFSFLYRITLEKKNFSGFSYFKSNTSKLKNKQKQQLVYLDLVSRILFD